MCRESLVARPRRRGRRPATDTPGGQARGFGSGGVPTLGGEPGIKQRDKERRDGGDDLHLEGRRIGGLYDVTVASRG